MEEKRILVSGDFVSVDVDGAMVIVGHDGLSVSVAGKSSGDQGDGGSVSVSFAEAGRAFNGAVAAISSNPFVIDLAEAIGRHGDKVAPMDRRDTNKFRKWLEEALEQHIPSLFAVRTDPEYNVFTGMGVFEDEGGLRVVEVDFSTYCSSLTGISRIRSNRTIDAYVVDVPLWEQGALTLFDHGKDISAVRDRLRGERDKMLEALAKGVTEEEARKLIARLDEIGKTFPGVSSAVDPGRIMTFADMVGMLYGAGEAGATLSFDNSKRTERVSLSRVLSDGTVVCKLAK